MSFVKIQLHDDGPQALARHVSRGVMAVALLAAAVLFSAAPADALLPSTTGAKHEN
jgi:hypothetical protein